jgi:hypothetical protein
MFLMYSVLSNPVCGAQPAPPFGLGPVEEAQWHGQGASSPGLSRQLATARPGQQAESKQKRVWEGVYREPEPEVFPSLACHNSSVVNCALRVVAGLQTSAWRGLKKRKRKDPAARG